MEESLALFCRKNGYFFRLIDVFIANILLYYNLEKVVFFRSFTTKNGHFITFCVQMNSFMVCFFCSSAETILIRYLSFKSILGLDDRSMKGRLKVK
uniref:Uncharacterized protein n=1 Tax=Listeria seeligeri TaxID=1640 RepID=A0A7T0MAT2_LISSE|nr:hypothetical protein pLIS400501c [Listeria seeligeri]